MKSIILIILVLISLKLSAEPSDSLVNLLKNTDYSKIDSTIVYSNFQIEEFVNFTNKNYKSDKEKVRAVYIFVINYMSYVYNPDGTPQTYEKGVKIAISKREGVCYDYSCLFKYLCLKVGLEAELVCGYVKKIEPDLRRNITSSNYSYVSCLGTHAWNIVKIDGEFFPIDPTWGDTNEILYVINHEWYLTNPKIFIQSHYPDLFYFENKINTNETGIYNFKTYKYGVYYLDDALKNYKENEKKYNGLSKMISYQQCLNKPITFEYFLCSKVTKKSHVNYIPLKMLPLNYYNLYLK